MMKFFRPARLPLFAILALSGVLVFSVPAHAADLADLSQRLKNCKIITSLITRGQCYDQVVSDFDIDKLERIDVGQGSGKWKVESETSPLSGSKNVYANLIADEYVQSKDGKQSRPALILRCMEKKMEGYVIWDSNLGEEDIVINLRVGTKEPEAERWKLSADKMATFVTDASGFTKKLLGQKSFTIKAWLDKQDYLLTSFDIRGADVALKPMIEACQAP